MRAFISAEIFEEENQILKFSFYEVFFVSYCHAKFIFLLYHTYVPVTVCPTNHAPFYIVIP